MIAKKVTILLLYCLALLSCQKDNMANHQNLEAPQAPKQNLFQNVRYLRYADTYSNHPNTSFPEKKEKQESKKLLPALEYIDKTHSEYLYYCPAPILMP